MNIRTTLLVLAWLLPPTTFLQGRTLEVQPTDSLSVVWQKLTADASISEVVFAEGVYHGGLTIAGMAG